MARLGRKTIIVLLGEKDELAAGSLKLQIRMLSAEEQAGGNFPQGATAVVCDFNDDVQRRMLLDQINWEAQPNKKPSWWKAKDGSDESEHQSMYPSMQRVLRRHRPRGTRPSTYATAW